MAHSTNVMIDRSTFNSAQDEASYFTIGIQNLVCTISGSIQRSIHIDDPMKDFIAIHDLAEHYPSPNCRPGTRKAVRDYFKLDHSKSSASSFPWLYGPASAGKTAILQVIVELLCTQFGPGQSFWASFSFPGEKGRVRSRSFLFSLIAYQLALKVPVLRQHVYCIMESRSQWIFITLSTIFLSWYHRRIKWMLRQGDPTVDSPPTPVQRSQFINYRSESHIFRADERSNPGNDIRVFPQSLLRKSLPRIAFCLIWNNHSHYCQFTTLLLSSYLLVPISATKQLALVWKPDPTALSDFDQLYTRLLVSVSIQAQWTLSIIQVLGILSASLGNLAEVISSRWSKTSAITWSVVFDERWEQWKLGVLVTALVGHLTSYILYLFNSSPRAHSMSIDGSIKTGYY